MNEPSSAQRLIGEVALRATADGGRRSGVLSGYRVQALLEGIVDFPPGTRSAPVVFNDCAVYFDAELLSPGQNIAARIYPLAPEFWSKVRPGDILGLYEGYRLVGSARIDGNIES